MRYHNSTSTNKHNKRQCLDESWFTLNAHCSCVCCRANLKNSLRLRDTSQHLFCHKMKCTGTLADDLGCFGSLVWPFLFFRGSFERLGEGFISSPDSSQFINRISQYQVELFTLLKDFNCLWSHLMEFRIKKGM